MTDSTKLNDWFQVAASVGVIISLVFVGLQIQQSREIAIADIYQQRAAMSIQVQQGNYTVERYERAVFKLLDGETLTPREEGLLRFAQNPWFSYWENVHFQYQIGLMSEEQWISSRNSMLAHAISSAGASLRSVISMGFCNSLSTLSMSASAYFSER